MSRSILFLNVLLLLFNWKFIRKQTGRSKQDYSDSICSLLYIVYICSLINCIVKQHNKENSESDEE